MKATLLNTYTGDRIEVRFVRKSPDAGHNNDYWVDENDNYVCDVGGEASRYSAIDVRPMTADEKREHLIRHGIGICRCASDSWEAYYYRKDKDNHFSYITYDHLDAKDYEGAVVEAYEKYFG